MVNFVYTFGDRETGEAGISGPAYRPGELIDLVEGDDMRVSAVFATHYHPDPCRRQSRWSSTNRRHRRTVG